MSTGVAHGRDRSAAEDAAWAYVMGGSALERLVVLHSSGCTSDDPEASLLGSLAEFYLCDLQGFLWTRWHTEPSSWNPSAGVATDLARLSTRPITPRKAADLLGALDRVRTSFHVEAVTRGEGFSFPSPGCRTRAT